MGVVGRKEVRGWGLGVQGRVDVIIGLNVIERQEKGFWVVGQGVRLVGFQQEIIILQSGGCKESSVRGRFRKARVGGVVGQLVFGGRKSRQCFFISGLEERGEGRSFWSLQLERGVGWYGFERRGFLVQGCRQFIVFWQRASEDRYFSLFFFGFSFFVDIFYG